MSNINIAISELHRAFYKFNHDLYNNELPEPAILIQNKGNKKNVLGWCSTKEIWIDETTKEMKYEINIVAEYLNRPVNEIMSTLLHEMAHLYDLVNDIKDVTRAGTYHNKNFKETAESHGLIIEHDKKIGWSLSRVNPEAEALIKTFKLNPEAFNLARIDIINTSGTKKKSSVRKYVCPCCGNIVRTTKELNIICGDCKVPFIQEE